MGNKIFLSLGTNLGDKSENLEQAIKHLETLGKILRRSSVYRTEAWGNIKEQDDYFNQVVIVDTKLEVEQCMSIILTIEQSMGRERLVKWGPRIIDIDILFYENVVIDIENLIVPHPRISERRFVLEPLAEVAPEYSHPLTGQSVVEMLKHCTDPCAVEKIARY